MSNQIIERIRKEAESLMNAPVTIYNRDAVIERIARKLMDERQVAIQEAIDKAKELGKSLRSVDTKLFPTLVIRAEAIEDFAKELEQLKVN